MLFRVAGLFSARGYNIESLTVARTQLPELSRMTVVTGGSDKLVRQIIGQLNKLVGVVKVRNLSEERHTEREAALIKVGCLNCDDNYRVTAVAAQHRASVVSCEEQVCLLELIAPSDTIDRFLDALSDHSIVEVVRSGVISLGDDALSWQAV